MMTKHAIAAIVLVLLAGTAGAQPSEPERLYLEGQKAYDSKRYDGALVAWNRSYELSKLPALLFNIAQAYRLRGLPGDCTRASDAYKRFIQLDPKSAQRPAAESFIAELKVCATPAPPVQPAPPVPPPAPRTVVTPPPAAAPPPAAPPPTATPLAPAPPMTRVDTGERSGGGGSGTRIAAFGAAGVGVALVATGVYFGNKASKIGDEVTETCRMGCDWSVVMKRDAEGRSAEKKQWVFYGIGGAALATSGVLFWLSMRDGRSSGLAVVPHGDGAAVSWSRTW